MAKPPIEVIEDYTKRKLRLTQNGGWEAELGWTVAWAPNEQQALLQPQIPVLYVPHPLNRSLSCTWVGVEEYNFNLTHVRALYSQTLLAADPLHKPAVLNVSRGTSTKQVDRDLAGHPLVISTGDAFTGATKDFLLREFTITRNEPYWDSRLDANYSDSVNSAPFAPLGFPALLPGQCHCVSILPGGPVIPGHQTYVPIVYSFEYAAGLTKDDNGVWDAFKLLFIDKGRQGWYQTNEESFGAPQYARGDFCDAKGNLINHDVLLDGTGKPIDPNVQVKDNNYGIHPATSAPADKQSSARKISLTKPSAVMLAWTMLAGKDYSVFHF